MRENSFMYCGSGDKRNKYGESPFEGTRERGGAVYGNARFALVRRSQLVRLLHYYSL